MRKKISFNAEAEDLSDLTFIIANVRMVLNQTDAIRWAIKTAAEVLAKTLEGNVN